MFSRSITFWEECSEWFSDQGEKTAGWGGDQRSMNAIAASGRFDVLELPCSTYNWSPEPGITMGDDVAIVHYKGARKNWH